jgi:uncharacterized protein (DUF885 family)
MPTLLRNLLLILIIAGFFSVNKTSRVAATQTAHQNADSRRAQLKQLLVDEWEYELRESPELATSIGDYRYNDRWSDSSLAHVQQQKRDMQQWLAKFEALDGSGFSEQEKLSQQLMVRKLKQDLEGIDLKTYEMPIDQFKGVHLGAAQFLSIIPFDSTKHYEDYLARLHQLPHVFEQIVEVLLQGEKEKLMPPRYLLEKTVARCKNIAEPAGEAPARSQISR